METLSWPVPRSPDWAVLASRTQGWAFPSERHGGGAHEGPRRFSQARQLCGQSAESNPENREPFSIATAAGHPHSEAHHPHGFAMLSFGRSECLTELKSSLGGLRPFLEVQG